MPVGNAPVVEKETAVLFAGAVVTVTTAGVAIVMLAVCVAVVSSTVQFVALIGIVAILLVTNSVVANWLLLDADGGVIANDTAFTVCVPTPATVTATKGVSDEDAEKLNVVALILET
jgi:hypothetical protein